MISTIVSFIKRLKNKNSNIVTLSTKHNNVAELGGNYCSDNC